MTDGVEPPSALRQTRSPAAHEEQLLEVCRLLVGLDRVRLQEAIRRLEDEATFGEHVSTVLAKALRIAAARDDKLADAVAPIVSAGVHETVERDPSAFGRALAPAMGPAIRQAVLQMFRGLVETLEKTLEQSLSPRGLKWRIQAWRTGKSFAEVAFLHTLAFRVEHVFLIHRETGLLLQHVHGREVKVREPDLVSAMLTAIQDFAADAFEAPAGTSLGAFQVGELNVWVEQGERAVVAAVIRGEAMQDVRAQLRVALENISVVHARQLAAFDGEVEAFETARPDLERCLVERRLEADPAEGKRKKSSAVGRVVLAGAAAVGLALLAFWWFRASESAARWEAFVAELGAEPGIVVTASADTGGRYELRGLRDPLARDPVAIAAEHGIDRARIDAVWQPFHSMHAEFALHRLARALGEPGTATVGLRDGVLVVEGEADHAWLTRLHQLAHLVPGVAGIDASRFEDTDRRGLEAAAQALHDLRMRVGAGPAPLGPNSADLVLDALRRLSTCAFALGQHVTVVCHVDGASRPEDVEAARKGWQVLVDAAPAGGVRVAFSPEAVDGPRDAAAGDGLGLVFRVERPR